MSTYPGGQIDGGFILAVANKSANPPKLIPRQYFILSVVYSKGLVRFHFHNCGCGCVDVYILYVLSRLGMCSQNSPITKQYLHLVAWQGQTIDKQLITSHYRS